VECTHERAVDFVPDAGLLLRQGSLARDEPDLHAQELVELEPLRGAAVIVVRLGPVNAPVRARAVGEAVLVEQRRIERVGEPARLGLLQAGAEERAQLPGEHLGLSRLRVHGHDRSGVLTDPVEHVDDGIRHLPAAAPVLDPPEERGFRTDGKLLLPPPLVEEHDP
jgi:hypothetical protein